MREPRPSDAHMRVLRHPSAINSLATICGCGWAL